MKHFFYILFILFILNACGSAGGVEAGNPPDLPTTRNVIGTLTGPGASVTATTRTIGDDCGADTLIATDSLSQTTTASVEADCSFLITLDIGKAYVLSLLNNDVFVASFIFNNSLTSINSIALIISSGESDLDLGNITINGNRASCEFEQEYDEEDCDLDGYPNSYDDDDDCSDESEEDDGEDSDDDDDTTDERAAVLEVSPRNGETEVSLDESIEARFGCDINIDTVDNTTFIISDGIINIDCTFSLDDANEVECEHATDFDTLTEYTVTLSGIECENGDPIDDINWSFTSEEEDD